MSNNGNEATCVACKMKPPTATPWLCLRCFKRVSSDFFKRKNNSVDNEEVFLAKLKNFQNRTQSRARAAYKRSATVEVKMKRVYRK